MIDEALAGGGFRSAFAQSMHEEMGNSPPVELQIPSPVPSNPETTLQFLRKRISYLTAENERLERQLRTEAEPCKDCTSSPLQVHIKTLNWQISQLKTQNQTYAETLKDVSRFCDRVYKSLSAYTKQPQHRSDDKSSYPRTTRSRSVNSLRGSETMSTTTMTIYDGLTPSTPPPPPPPPQPQATSTPNGAVAKRVMKRRPKSSIVDNTVIGVYKPPTPVAEIDSDELPPEKLLNEAHKLMRTIQSVNLLQGKELDSLNLIYDGVASSCLKPELMLNQSSSSTSGIGHSTTGTDSSAEFPSSESSGNERPATATNSTAPSSRSSSSATADDKFDHLDHEIITDEYCDYVAEIKTARLVRRTANDCGDGGVDFESTVAEAPRKTSKTYVAHTKDKSSSNQTLASGEKTDGSIAESSSFEARKNLTSTSSDKNDKQAPATSAGNEMSTPKFSKATVKASIKRLRDWTFNETETQDSKTDACSRSITDDESGFSSLSSFQEIGLPQVQNNNTNNNHGSSSPIKKTGSHTEVGLPEVPLRAAIHHRRWSSTPSEVKAMFRRHSSINRASETMSVWV